jgi:hypothetical protein
MVSPDSQAIACPLSGRNSTYRPVQISGTGSVNPDARVMHLSASHLTYINPLNDAEWNADNEAHHKWR